MRTLAIFFLSISSLAFSQNFTDTVLYVEIQKTSKNNFGRTPSAYFESGVIVEYIEKRYSFFDCKNKDLEFHSYKNTPVKTVTNRELKKYPVITFAQLCNFLVSLSDDQKKVLIANWTERYGPPLLEDGHEQSPDEMYLFNLKKIYFVEKADKGKKATITLVYYHTRYL